MPHRIPRRLRGRKELRQVLHMVRIVRQEEIELIVERHGSLFRVHDNVAPRIFRLRADPLHDLRPAVSKPSQLLPHVTTGIAVLDGEFPFVIGNDVGTGRGNGDNHS